jgi:hypothetical protein
MALAKHPRTVHVVEDGSVLCLTSSRKPLHDGCFGRPLGPAKGLRTAVFTCRRTAWPRCWPRVFPTNDQQFGER